MPTLKPHFAFGTKGHEAPEEKSPKRETLTDERLLQEAESWKGSAEELEENVKGYAKEAIRTWEDFSMFYTNIVAHCKKAAEADEELVASHGFKTIAAVTLAFSEPAFRLLVAQDNPADAAIYIMDVAASRVKALGLSVMSKSTLRDNIEEHKEDLRAAGKPV